MRTLVPWALAVALLAGCRETSRTLLDPCEDVSCGDDPLVRCDPVDALCKCGRPELNLVCGDDEVCRETGESAFACVNVRCELVTCDRGETCDPSSGACACGTGPDVRRCAPGQTCENGRCTPGPCDGVACTLGSRCDPDDGVCRCGDEACDEGVVCLEGACDRRVEPCELYPPDCRPGESCVRGACSCAGGPACEDGERCGDGVCRPDPCWGVNCPAGSVCGPADSACHCGDETGPICSAGQACSGRACVASALCETVACPPGMVCDPDPASGGVCRCGGVGAEFPRCGRDQTCDLSGPLAACKGGDPCREKDCAKETPGSSCDPEDGACKCGGLEGVPCAGGGAACSVEDGVNACTQICDPFGHDCTGEDGCYYEPRRGLSICRPQGDAPPGRSCKESRDCTAGSFCAQVQDGMICRELCNVETQEGCPEDRYCVRLGGTSDPRTGQCLSAG